MGACFLGPRVPGQQTVPPQRRELACGRVLFGFFAAWYYLFPKITSYAYSNLLGRIHFWLLFIGVNIVFVPQIFLFARMVERLPDAPDGFRYWNQVSWIGSSISAASTLGSVH
jgi:cytochrome c oxidase subunit I